MRSVLFVITGFGGPNKVNEKIQWLHHNIKILNKNSKKQRIKMLIFCYDNTEIPLPEELDFEVEIIHKKGFVFQFLYENVPPSYLIENYFTYFHGLMDDVELPEDYDLEEVLNFYESEKCDIIQHALTSKSKSPHKGMYQIENLYANNTDFIEFFSYIMDVKNYMKYYNFFDEKTRCGWGIDLVMKYYFERLYILHKYPINHYINGEGYEFNKDFDKFEEANRTLKKFK